MLEHIDNLNECSGKERGEVKRTICSDCFLEMGEGNEIKAVVSPDNRNRGC